MPIYENAKSTQIRVAVSVGGVLRQRYFYPKSPEMLEQLRKEACQLNMEWKFEANMNIKAQGFDMAWFNAVNYLCSIKGVSGCDPLLKKKPPIEQFAVIYKWQCQQGHTIPKERLPDEFLDKSTQRELFHYMSA